MIDWLKMIAPLHHDRVIADGQVLSVSSDGDIQWQVHKRRKLRGSHEADLQVRTHEFGHDLGGTFLEVDGNPVKWFQGHNIFGTDDVHGLALATLDRVCEILSVEPTPQDRLRWQFGDIRLQRVDVTYSYQLDSPAQVQAYVRSMEQSAHMRHRGPGVMKDGTLYFGMNSRRWALKVYSKGQEVKATGHRPPSSVLPAVIELAGPLVRFEVVLRRMELKRLGLGRVCDWPLGLPCQVHAEYLEHLDMTENVTLTTAAIADLSPRLRAAYQCWLDGHDLRQMYPRKTFYRYRRELLKHGIDVAVKQPRDRSNVVPLVHTLVARPWSPPEWVYGTEWYFEPRKAG